MKHLNDTYMFKDLYIILISAYNIVSNVVTLQGTIRRWVTTSPSSAVLMNSFLVGFVLLKYAYIKCNAHYCYLYLSLNGLKKWIRMKEYNSNGNI